MRTEDTDGRPGKAADAAAALPSYDDVMQSVHEEQAASSRGQASTSTAAAAATAPSEVGPFSAGKGAPRDSTGAAARESVEAQPLLVPHGYSHSGGGGGGPEALSSRDFFSSLEYKRTSKGYSSADPLLNTDARALRRFIAETNERPRVTIYVEGSHMEERPTGRRTVVTMPQNQSQSQNQQEAGVYQQEADTRREKVVDFGFVLELTPFIHSSGSLYTAQRQQPQQAGGEAYEIDAVLEDYVQSDNVLKEICVQKKAIWDYEAARRLIIDFVRNAVGYPHTVSVQFPMENDRIRVKSHSAIGRVWRHPVTSFLCCITCACAIGWPVRHIATQRWRNRLMSDFVVLVAPHDFVARHADFIRTQVVWSTSPFTIVSS
ncbi:hypothetical protein IWQ57_001250 [Coemansia nantahalensis]|uniref:Uncharacterized protein n=1 Tax=Coemansia nantahalensis TaxID=2789366 RepID=A0ACC1K554_9FUNG|nr:hypothetical protein IWQ57_001250 [Coemansia nantahalensis]